jgi:tRNA(fMet)-specific endonuclease VapC
MLPADLTTAEEYGIVKSRLSKKGTLIPDNDIWIAAQALQYGLKVATGDSHFNHVDGLVVEKW